jgi:trimethylamine---corrinoid protein Co-methyltransferase
MLKILSDNDVSSIHHAALCILDKTGVRISHPEGLELLRSAGTRLEKGRAFIPAILVERCLKMCPRQTALRGHDGRRVVLGDGVLKWHNAGGPPNIIDLETGKPRPATCRDVSDCARVLDALASVDSMTPFFTPQDVPGKLMGLAMYRYCLSGTNKPVSSPGYQNAADFAWLVRMAQVVGKPEEILAMGISPVSPLFFTDMIAGAILECAYHGIAVHPMPSPTAGATAPMPLAGLLAQQHAEILAGLVLAELAHPGLPIVYSGRHSILNPRNGGAAWGLSALGLASAAEVQLGHFCGLPVNTYGLSSDSQAVDFQNGYERALNGLLPAMAGADELSGIGALGAGVSGSYAMMVCDDDLVMQIKQLCKGMKVDQDSLAIDLVGQVAGEGGSGNYMAERHTVQHLRSGEFFFPPIAVRMGLEEWTHSGQKTMVELAREKARKILTGNHPQPLSVEQEKELDLILKKAEMELA